MLSASVFSGLRSGDAFSHFALGLVGPGWIPQTAAAVGITANLLGFLYVVSYVRRVVPSQCPVLIVLSVLLVSASLAVLGVAFGAAEGFSVYACAWLSAVIAWGGAYAIYRLLPTLDGARVDREVTEQTGEWKGAETALRPAPEFFRAFMDNGPLRCWIVNGDGVCHYANRAFEKGFDLPGGIMGRRMQEIFSPALADKLIESDGVVLRQGRGSLTPDLICVGGAEYEIYKFPVVGADGTMMVGGIALDVTDQRSIQATLRKSSELLTLVTEAMRVYLETGDWKTAHGLLLRCALRQTQSEYGFVGVVVDGPKLRILAHEGVRWSEYFSVESYEQAVRENSEHGYLEFTRFDNLPGRVVTSGEVVIANSSPAGARAGAAKIGEALPVQGFLGVPVKRGKQVVGLIAVANRSGGYDSSSQSQLETLVQQAGVLCDSYRRGLREASLEEQVRVSQKMEAVGLLAGGVAHDFNNLLQVIKGYTSFALESETPWADRRVSLEQVRTAAERAAQLTQQLLAFGRQQTLQKGDLDLNVAITELLRMIRRVIGETITVDFVPGHDLGNVQADRAQVDQVLLNLCLNARDALMNGGRITIETENVLVNGTFRESHPWAKPGRYVLITVSDNGIGMDKETVARIFEPFFTTKGKDKGTGLGLAVVYGVVKQHDGMVHVYSEPGKGTTFKIYLPIVARAASSVGPKHTPSHPRGTETILLAEDEPMVRELAKRILMRSGYTVLVASDGAEACALFALHASEINLAILDVVMPQLGGRETYQRIAAQCPGLPVIFCSGYAGSALGAESLNAPGARLLAKPYGGDEMLEAVRTALDHH